MVAAIASTSSRARGRMSATSGGRFTRGEVCGYATAW
jgi:hypothetical protein